MHVRVQKWGNSLAVRIPKPLAEDAEVKEGTVLNLAVRDAFARPELADAVDAEGNQKANMSVSGINDVHHAPGR